MAAVDDLRVEITELDPRVDRMFASAMEQQLEEQRTLTRLAKRVEAALDELQRGLGGLTGHLTAVAVPLPAEVERTRTALLDAIARLQHDADASHGQVFESLERLRAQFDLSRLGGQIEDLAGRVEQGTAPLPVAMSEMRTTLVKVLERVERVSTHSRTDLSEWLGVFWNEFEGRLSSGQDEAVRAVTAAQRALTEQAGRIETLRERLGIQAGHAADRVAALLDHATANQREALAAITAAANQLTTEAASTREAVSSQSDTLREAVAEAVAGAQAGLDRSVATARTVSEQLARSGAASRESVERMQELVEALGTRLEQAQVAGTRRLSQAAAVLERAAESVHPAVGELRQALSDTAAVGRAQAETSAAAFRDSTDGLISELRALVEEGSRRLSDAHASGTAELSSAAAGVVRAAEDLQPAFSSALARLYGAVAAAATQVRATSEESAARTDAALAEALRGIELTISDRLVQANTASQEAATRLAEVQATAVTRLEQVAEKVGERADSLHPALVETADELRQSLLEAAAENQSRIDVPLGAIQRTAEEAAGAVREAADAAVERLSLAIAETAERLSAVQHADTGALTDAADHVARTAESLTPAVSSALERVNGTVNEALALVEGELERRLEASDAAVQAAAAGLLTASDDAQERLRVWLAGALPDAVAQVTVGLADQLERVEARVGETANRLEAVCDQADGGLQEAAERANVRMTEAAQALTAAAEESVGGADHRLALLGERIDVLIERMDGISEMEARHANAAEALLARLNEYSAGPAWDLEPPQMEEGLAHELESAALSLQDTVARAEDVERRVADGLERAVDRLDAATSGLGRLEASLIDYLRDRDRAAAADRDRLITDLSEQLGQFGATASRKEGRLLGGLRPSGRRREEPPNDPLPHASRSVRPETMPLESLRPEPNRGSGRIVPADRGGTRRESAPPGDPTHARRPAPPLPACDVCGFVGKNAAGLAAHRRTHR